MHDSGCLALLGQAQQHQHRLQVVAQLQQLRQPLPRRVGADDLSDHLAAGLAQFRAQGILVVAGKPRHHLLEVHRRVQGGLVDGQMFVTGHG